jgi:uncharacterized membrane protein YhaH (DUF805 family)
MEAVNWYVGVLKQYVTFAGRARRREYWFYILVTVIVYAVLLIADSATGTVSSSGIGALSGLYSLATLLPGLAVGVRRLHDTDRSGWWMLISLVPLVGPIVLLVFLVQDSKAEANPYGPNPKLSGPAGGQTPKI